MNIHNLHKWNFFSAEKQDSQLPDLSNIMSDLETAQNSPRAFKITLSELLNMFCKIPVGHRLKWVNQNSFEFFQLLRKSSTKDDLRALSSAEGNKG